jgi:hypothetical protein
VRVLDNPVRTVQLRSVARASRLQVRFRAIAATTAVWLVVCGVLAARHEAHVAHVRTVAGAYAHGKLLAGHHVGHQSDVHGQRNPDGDAGECALLTAFHQPASARITPPAVVTTAHATLGQSVPRAATLVVVAAVYRVAPKTSPPAAG